ncbi:MAG TPA: ferritin-like domain-containing protein [Blastocatellia bacterium]|nr:ferritin-like domain-containing protein [Blastocatellia bacterium]
MKEAPESQSPDRLTGLLTRVYRDEMHSVESLSIAVRYFSRFPGPALSFARCSADGARHVAVVASRLVELTGKVTSVPGRSAALERMPGFKSDERGDLEDLVRFVSRVYADGQRAMVAYQTVAESIGADVASMKIFRRLAQDEQAHVGSFEQIILWLADQGYMDSIRAAFAEDGVEGSCLHSTE